MAQNRRHATIILGQDRLDIVIVRDTRPHRDHVWHVEEHTYDVQSGALVHVSK